MKIVLMETLVENFLEKIWFSGKYFVYLTLNYNLIEKNYDIRPDCTQISS
jgi:hypothetical protein